ncbi:helix-turn-helix transcriptional regulator [Pseudomonas viridiflava]|uniref:helix-turn-helix transcriptional regulator n=1 Tax=Pseudomonas viridiflava TaxID=33069 RepID=UPI000F06B194|nr:AlpA family phage regulatory protein [Pseudomonas viridiflava]MEE4961386.1 AlpA family phage regulatory protein [Pseudomonas alliivorans]MEE4973549.1 AlpA family phage regulatory protein [Pseudomonas alliivorans]MEE4977879.1 AlpA family phage regulatory protein [Pseudomonas alliivorans]MEE4982515.1 AlpA family phage regulatory protein [Pseudomonas alliivorans]MEE5005277.1 AlpA family phage regulatory protein [Pseudomonas alliivorans]
MSTSVTEFPRETPANAPVLFDAASTLIRMREVEGIVGMKRSTIYKLMQQPASCFPQPVKLSNSTARGAPVAWVLSEVQAWARSRIAARDQVAA